MPLGGIADGIIGSSVGIVTAVNAMRENERIKAENAAGQEWGAKRNAFYQELAIQAEEQMPSSVSMVQLKDQYEAIFSWSPDTLFPLISISTRSIEINPDTGAVTVAACWRQTDKSLCIDGALRAKLYTEEGECAGCAYLVLPKEGTAGCRGVFSGICAQPVKPASKYSVKYEPVNLWELASKQDQTERKSDDLTMEEHRKIVADYEGSFQAELNVC